MSFGLIKSLIIITLIQGVIAKDGLSSFALSEESSSPLCVKSSSTTAKPNNKRTFNKQVSQTPICDYFKATSKKPNLGESNFSSSSSSPETIDLRNEDSDKENIYSFSSQQLSSVTLSSNEKQNQELAAFKSYFRTPSPAQYDQIKEKILKQKWPISTKGNPYINISSLQSPDGKSHRIVITQSWSKFKSKIEYSAFIDNHTQPSLNIRHWVVPGFQISTQLREQQ